MPGVLPVSAPGNDVRQDSLKNEDVGNSVYKEGLVVAVKRLCKAMGSKAFPHALDFWTLVCIGSC